MHLANSVFLAEHSLRQIIISELGLGWHRFGFGLCFGLGLASSAHLRLLCLLLPSLAPAPAGEQPGSELQGDPKVSSCTNPRIVQSQANSCASGFGFGFGFCSRFRGAHSNSQYSWRLCHANASRLEASVLQRLPPILPLVVFLGICRVRTSFWDQCATKLMQHQRTFKTPQARPRCKLAHLQDQRASPAAQDPAGTNQCNPVTAPHT